MDEELRTFTTQIRRRSLEHVRAIELLAGEGLLAPAVATLRQEVDSLTRVIYLLAQPLDYRRALIRASVSGERWRRQNSRAPVTDLEMVELSSRLMGWTQSVYRFGCSFIHLSNLHAYNAHDPLEKLSPHERSQMLSYLRNYHDAPESDRPSLSEFLPLLPKVLQKISTNMEPYLLKLENGVVETPEDIW